MTTITRRKVYFPPYRIGTNEICEQWGGGSKGVQSKAVQAKDDDATTLAVQAGRAALDGRTDVDAVFFATTTPVYEYGSMTPFLVSALGLNEDTYVQTFGESSRAGTAALRAAHEAATGDSDVVLVVAAEAPSPVPHSDREKVAGAGAGAAVIEADGDGLEHVAAGARSRPLIEEWQAPDADAPSTADDRFARDVGYVETIRRAVEDALDSADWAPGDVDTFAVTHPNGKFARRVAGATGLGDALATPSFGSDYGNLRSASALGSLAMAELAAGDGVVVAGYGAGTADALVYEVSAAPEAASEPEETVELEYVDYLKHVNQLE